MMRHTRQRQTEKDDISNKQNELTKWKSREMHSENEINQVSGLENHSRTIPNHLPLVIGRLTAHSGYLMVNSLYQSG